MGKFIQIAVAQTLEELALYALDADGRVWWFTGDNKGWLPLPNRRQPLPALAEDLPTAADA